MYILANRDIEIACDETVVRIFGESNKSSYALALIELEEKKSGLAPLFVNFSKNVFEERIVSIMKIKKTTMIGMITALALIAGTTAVFATSGIGQKKDLGMFEKAMGSEAYPYAENINKVSDKAAAAVTEEYAVYIDRTIFTDQHVYAILGAKGNLPGSLDVSGKIAYADHEQDLYRLKGEIRELESVGETRYFFYSAALDLADDEDDQEKDPMLVLAAGDRYQKCTSLRESEEENLELKVISGDKEHTLKAAVDNVSTNAFIFYPDAKLYKGDYYSKVVLTPWEVKFYGHSEKTYESYEEWNKQLRIKLTIVLRDGKKINMSCDTRGTVYDEGYTLGMSRGADIESGDFYHWWDFHGWELDLNNVRSIILDGETYRAVK